MYQDSTSQSLEGLVGTTTGEGESQQGVQLFNL